MNLNPFAELKFEDLSALNNPPNEVIGWGNSFSQWGGGLGGSLVDSPPNMWEAAAISNPPPASSRPSRPAEQAIGSLYNEILKEQLGQFGGRSGAGLFDRDYQSNVANRKR